MVRVLARYTLVALVVVPLAACSSKHHRGSYDKDDRRRVETHSTASDGIPGQHEFHDAAHAFAHGVDASALPEAAGGGRARVVCRSHMIHAFPGVDTEAFATEICQALEETGQVQIIRGHEGIEPDYLVKGQVQKTSKLGSTIYLELVDRMGRPVVKMPRAYAKPLGAPDR